MPSSVDRRRWLDRWMPWLVALLAVAVAASGVLSTLAFVANSDRVDQINTERVRNIERNCIDVNARHDAALTALDVVLDRAGEGASPERLRQIEQSRQSTKLLIEALVPKRDCVELAARQVTE